jgi:hypothetical protein
LARLIKKADWFEEGSMGETPPVRTAKYLVSFRAFAAAVRLFNSTALIGDLSVAVLGHVEPDSAALG